VWPGDGDDLSGDFGSEAGGQLGSRLQILANSVLDVLDRLLASRSLAAAAGQFFAPYRKAFFGLDERYRVVRGCKLAFRNHLSSPEELRFHLELSTAQTLAAGDGAAGLALQDVATMSDRPRESSG
jgi:hypothetical protein